MNRIYKLTIVVLLGILQPFAAIAEEMMIEDFKSNPETRWSFFADTVMGGASSGSVQFVREGEETHANLSGRVTTENNGGFIQIRSGLSDKPTVNLSGIRLVVRGNDQRYFIHLRTRTTLLPWQYYQASFDVSSEWAEVRLPFGDFKASSSMLRTKVTPKSLRSLGIVAFGRDHLADLDIREVGYY